MTPIRTIAWSVAACVAGILIYLGCTATAQLTSPDSGVFELICVGLIALWAATASQMNCRFSFDFDCGSNKDLND